jgi:4-hydroxy-tetrahydrodipicolinate synthase
MAHAYLEGELAEAISLQLGFLPLIRALFAEPNPIPVKTAVRWLGFDVGPLRQPLCEADPARQQVVIQELEGMGIRRRARATS